MTTKQFTLPIYSQQGKEIKKIELDKSVFDGTVNQEVLYQAILMYRANQRRGLASTKTRGEVSGGGKKPWRQKGTGRARVGSSRNPLWRKGGVVFGPHPTKVYGFTLPKKIKLAALRASLNSKLNEGNLLILEDLKLSAPKTKEAARILSSLKLNEQPKPASRGKADAKKTGVPEKPKQEDSAVLMLDDTSVDLERSFRNIGFLEVVKVAQITALDVLKSKKLIATVNGIKGLTERIKRRL
ncbi:50S ribosomal protein L4 [Candidatus Omnitrophota bacterium]